MSTCYKTSDNKHFGCPPRMSDGRHFTDYRPSCDINSAIRGDNSIPSSFQYRNFLQQNAEKLLNLNRKHACMKNCCGPCGEPFEPGTMLPEKYMVNCDANTCTRVLNDPQGLGDGRVYFTNHPGCNGLPASWPVDQQTNQCSTPEDNFYYFGATELEGQMMRYTHPRGGNALGGGDTRVTK